MNQTGLRADLGSPGFKADPFPFFARLRAEEPVHRHALSRRRAAWLVSRYDDAVGVMTDRRFVKDRANASTPDRPAKAPWVPGPFRPLTRNMLDVDEPDHRRLRTLVQTAFTPRRIAGIAVRIEALADELLDRAGARGEIDLVAEFALPIPTTIIAELLGVPAGDRHRFHRWSSRIVAADRSPWAAVRAIPAGLAFVRYLRRRLAGRRAVDRDDLLGALVRAEAGGERLSEDELLAMAFLLIVAGHETTVSLIGNGALALLDHPDEKDRLAADPALLEPAVEELLRFAGPLVLATERYASDDLEVAGVTIPRGELVYVALASANRDERQFPHPDRLDLAREPNRHLAFGHGIHFCLGAPLARLEARIAFGRLLARFPDFRLATDRDRLRWSGGLVLRGVQALPLSLGAEVRDARRR
ncbi:MAG TPA: cytochrome P450 [Gemmatimonadota bacterium]|nr:cytochrome P450 [Gemmatimonadota bacterium]